MTTQVNQQPGSFGRIQSKHQRVTFLLFEMFHICAQYVPHLDTFALFTVNNLLYGNTKNEWSMNGAYLTVITVKAKKRK